MNRLYSVLILVLFSTVCFTVGAFAGDQNSSVDKRESRFESRRDEMFKALGLTQEQQQALSENRKAHREQTRKLYESMHAKMDEMSQELQKEQYDPLKVAQIKQELKDIQNRILELRVNSIIEVRNILTPAQFAQFSKKMQEHRKQWRQGKKGSSEK